MPDYRIARSNNEVVRSNELGDPVLGRLNQSIAEALLESPMGDFVISSDGDLALASIEEGISQTILWELRTYPGDYFVDPQVGIGLADFMGQPNIPKTRDAMRSRIMNRLLVRNVGATIKDVEVLEFKEDMIIIGITVQLSVRDLALNYLFDVNTGEIERLDVSRE